MNEAADIISYESDLKHAGVPPNQAEVHALQLASFIDNILLIKKDILLIENNFKKDLKDLEIKVIFTLFTLISVSTSILGTLIKIFS